MHDTDFLLTKAIVSKKVNALLNQTHDQLKQFVEAQHLAFPEGVLLKAGKISRGENYQHLPYLLLDYPRKFAQDDVFALRTMFWWGNFYSVTFQLGGQSWQRYRAAVMHNIGELQGASVSLCLSEDPWQHHRDSTYYRSLNTMDTESVRKKLEQQNFLKLATFLTVDEWHALPGQALSFFKTMIRLIEL